MKSIRKLLIAIALAFSFGVGLTETTPVNAEESGSVTLKNWPVNGTTFELYKIADLNGSDYTAVNASYAEYIDDKDIGNMNASESESLAEKIAKVTEDKRIEEDASITYGTNNTFSNLSTGLYLLKGEVSKKGEVTYTPQVSLIILPAWDGDNRVFSLTVEPKYEKTEPSLVPTHNTVIQTNTIGKKSEPVNTGDHSHVVMYSVIAAGSIALIILIIVLRKRTREE